MATPKATYLLNGLFLKMATRHSGDVDSVKARKAIHKAFENSGGPTPRLKRVYGEYLEYKRAKAEKIQS